VLESIASIRVIEKNKGKLENEIFDPHENLYVKRYWFQ